MGRTHLFTRMLCGTGMTIELMIINTQDIFAAGLLAFPSPAGSDGWLNNSSF